LSVVVFYPSVTSGSILPQVEKAVAALEKAQVIRNSEEGYKLVVPVNPYEPCNA
jgi:hypothetical protein